ncbi:MAG: helix-turn-helix transcriptional regulator [Candidatus Rokubacteria bacterium]|nr:helix-turn-helix transcriptional regulator [Candidatus Rokubacteria bacterium]
MKRRAVEHDPRGKRKYPSRRAGLAGGSVAEQIRDLRRRLAPDPGKPISQQRFGDLMGVAWSTVARWEGGSKPDARVAAKLARLRRALDALGKLIMPEDRLLFFEQHHPLLLKMRPIDLLDTEDGTAAVMRLIEGLESGAFS